MKRALITGVSGFVGPYLKNEIEHDYQVFGVDVNVGDGSRTFSCDILDYKKLLSIINKIKPTCIFHLAGFSSVKDSFSKPLKTKRINVDGTKNLLDAVVETSITPTILIVSSAEVYGNPKNIPIKETDPVNPSSPYATSRIEQEKLALKYNLPIIISRSFNHTGPGQKPFFVVPAFAKQIAIIELNNIDPIIKVGNLDAKRDFSDVRDIVMAYQLLIKKGEINEIYNVCSGKSLAISDILNKLLQLSTKKIKVVRDNELLRPSDIPVLVGDNGKLMNQTGYKSQYKIFDTLRDTLNYWRNTV